MWRLALLLSVVVVGCADPCADLGASGLVLGSADEAGEGFLPVAPMDRLILLAGLQGGAHLWLKARITGVCPSSAVVDRRVVDAVTSEVFLVGRGPIEFEDVGGEEFESGLLRLALCPDPSARVIDGRELRVVASVVDSSGRRADAQVPFTASCNGERRCESFCTGGE